MVAVCCFRWNDFASDIHFLSPYATPANMPERPNSDFLAGLFDDITTSRVITDLNLDQDVPSSSARRGSMDNCCRPPKKIRLESSSPRSSMLTMRMSRYRLAELSFPSLPIGERSQSSGPQAVPSQPANVPLPSVSLTKRRLTMRPSWEIGMVDDSRFSTFLTPSVSNPNEAGASACLQPSLASSPSKEQETESGSSSDFGWFVESP